VLFLSALAVQSDEEDEIERAVGFITGRNAERKGNAGKGEGDE
jgi:hypothetical protein